MTNKDNLLILGDESENQSGQWTEQNKRALEEALKRFESAVETIRIGITISNPEGRILYSNPADATMHGYDRQELIGKDARIFAPAEFWNPIKMQRLSEMQTWKREALNIRKDGSVFPVELTSEALISPNGEIIGVITTCEDITERKQKERELSRKAMYDALTGLANRILFLDRLEQLHKQRDRNAKSFAVLFLDLDHFKRVNDKHGHSIGDELLEKLAQRIVSSLRPSDTVARLGGDEFTALLERIGDQKEAVNIAARIATNLKPPFLIQGKEIAITASIGIAMDNGISTQPEDILHRADAAMYRAKARGRNRYQVFDGIMISSNSAEERYLTRCTSCTCEFNALESRLCKCISIERTFVCPKCSECFCKASIEYKEAFWASAPEALWQQKAAQLSRREFFRPPIQMFEPKRPLILIAEHNRLFQWFTLDLIEEMGFHGLVVEDGATAFNLAVKYLPDLVFADTVLPKLDGGELCRRLKENQPTSHIKVILKAGGFSARQKREITQFRPDESIRLPISFKELNTLLNKYLR